jgi:hypothetical protein
MRLLYHGCPESASKKIIERGFNRSYGGINGKISYVFMDFIRLFSQDVFMEEGYISPRRLVIQRSIQVQMKEKKNECFIVVFLLAVVRVSHDILIILKNCLIF